MPEYTLALVEPLLFVRGTESLAVRCEMNDPMLAPHIPIAAFASDTTGAGDAVDSDKGRSPALLEDEDDNENVEERAGFEFGASPALALARSTSDREISTGVLEAFEAPSSVATELPADR